MHHYAPTTSTRSARLAAWPVIVAACMATNAFAQQTLTWDTAATSGFQATSGTWDFNNTANWTTDGTTLLPWSSNADVARFQLSGSASQTVTIATSPQVGASGIEFAGSLGGSARVWELTGGTLQLGAGGIDYTATNQTVRISAPLQLTASQTWRSDKNQADVFVITGDIGSAAAAVTDLTFDGRNAGSSVMLTFAGANTFSGSMTLSNRGALKLDYTSQNNSKLDDNRALVLGGGSLVQIVSASSGSHVELVGSTTLKAGSNRILGTQSAGSINLKTITRETAGMLDVNASSGGVNGIYRTDNANVNNLLGGWATSYNSTQWARNDGTGVVVGTNGSNLNDPNGWGTTSNVLVNATHANQSGISSKTINVLKIGAATTLSFQPGEVLTVNAGGIINANASGVLTGGQLTTGMSTGELFVHTPSAMSLDSQIVDNGSTPTILVKGGSNTLTTTTDHAYTGQTFINAGTLRLDNGGSLANSQITILGGGRLEGGPNGDGGTLNFLINGDDADLISVAEGIGNNNGGILDLTNLSLNLLASGTQTEAEYVLVDRAVGHSSIIGSAFRSVMLPEGWAIEYAGTSLNPDSIVAIAVPEPSALLGLFVAGAALMGRRRRV